MNDASLCGDSDTDNCRQRFYSLHGILPAHEGRHFSPNLHSPTKGQTPLSDGRKCPKEKGDMPCMPPFIFLMSFSAPQELAQIQIFVDLDAHTPLMGKGRLHAQSCGFLPLAHGL